VLETVNAAILADRTAERAIAPQYFTWPQARLQHGTREGFWYHVRSGKPQCPECSQWGADHRMDRFLP
jgi:hypothetical protein